MRISVFGGTGPTGLLLVEQALAAGHQVVAFARTPDKLPEHERLTVIGGQLADADAIGAAIEGSDAVLSVLGPGRNSGDVPPLVVGNRNIVTAMRAHGVSRLVALATPSARDDADTHDWKVALMVALVKHVQPVAYGAIVDVGEIVRTSGLDWTLVRVPLLTNRPGTEAINARRVGQKGGLRLSRANAAAFLLHQATDTAYMHQAPFISDT